MDEYTEEPDKQGSDVEIAGRFAHLRRLEMASAPAITTAATPAAGAGAFTVAWPVRPAVARVAAVLALVVIALGLFSPSAKEDPAALYASIMDKQQMQTDTLLNVSASVLPAMTDLPSFYEFDVEFDYQIDPN
jgi:hypothetical protein